MSQHEARLLWERESEDFSYQGYTRNHSWTFPSGTQVQASAAPTYLGDESRVDPEEAFVATIASCHMLTFLAIAARKRVVVDSYADRAVGVLAKNSSGKLAITNVTLNPKIVFAGGSSPDEDALRRMHDLAHHECFIANSVVTEVTVAY